MPKKYKRFTNNLKNIDVALPPDRSQQTRLNAPISTDHYRKLETVCKSLNYKQGSLFELLIDQLYYKLLENDDEN